MHIQMFSIHGLVRGNDIELGRDADTGGQVRYVVELAKDLAKDDRVTSVDLITRLIDDSNIDSSYAIPIEPLCDRARIVRIPCGDCSYQRKELLWPLLDEFTQNLIAFNEKEGRTPDILHGHYADAGYVARLLAEHYDRPFVFTGHSLGRPKLQYLLEQGWTHEKANEVLNIDYRIQQEQESLNAASLVVCSTRHERDDQYGNYETPCRPTVIPPGTDLDRFYPPGVDGRDPESPLIEEIKQFLREPDKPWILTVARPDRRKNLPGLVEAFGQCEELQQKANLEIVAGNREDITERPDNEQQVFTEMLMLKDKYNLYGNVALPKTHRGEDIPEVLRHVAANNGVFVNSAFIELFGLTAIEAAACGLPFVGPEAGGPVDIVANCQCGLTVNTADPEQMQQALLRLLDDPELREEMSESGRTEVGKFYSWEAHASTFVDHVSRILARRQMLRIDPPQKAPLSAFVPADDTARELRLSLDKVR